MAVPVEMCSHPLLVPTMWNQPKPEPARMSGACEHNMSCPVCGYGWGMAPDFCDTQTHPVVLA